MSPADRTRRVGGDALSTVTAPVQPVRVYRQGPDGVNATTWSLRLRMSAFWVADGTAARSPEIVVSSILGAPFMIRLLGMLDGAARRRGLLRAVASASRSWPRRCRSSPSSFE